MKAKNVNIHQHLIEKCINGDKQAQFEVYKLYYDAMYNTVYRIINNSQEAEDIMQEAFLQAFNNILHYKREVSFGAWLKKIVVNKALDYLRKNKLDTLNIDEKPINIVDNTYESCEYEKDINIKVLAIKNAINSLPEKDRILINLYLIEGYDQQEISEILNISYSSVRTGYSRAKKRLQSVLKFK